MLNKIITGGLIVSMGTLFMMLFFKIWIDGQLVAVENNKAILIIEMFMSVAIFIYGVYLVVKELIVKE